jgi:hypothetical protein
MSVGGESSRNIVGVLRCILPYSAQLSVSWILLVRQCISIAAHSSPTRAYLLEAMVILYDIYTLSSRARKFRLSAHYLQGRKGKCKELMSSFVPVWLIRVSI